MGFHGGGARFDHGNDDLLGTAGGQIGSGEGLEEGGVGIDGVAKAGAKADPVEEAQGDAGFEGAGPEEGGDMVRGKGRRKAGKAGVI